MGHVPAIPETAVPVTAATSSSYGDEMVLTLTNGRQLRCDAYDNAPHGASYVRVTDRDGNEVAYWDSAEWSEPDEAKLVMGAIFGAAKGEV